MMCPTCRLSFDEDWETNSFIHDRQKLDIAYSVIRCCYCGTFVLKVDDSYTKVIARRDFMPYCPVPREYLYAPDEIWKDYAEACRVLAKSPNAAAMLVRRCLEKLLKVMGYDQRTLEKQISRFEAELSSPNGQIIGSLGLSAYIIRKLGNLSAHSVTSKDGSITFEAEFEEALWAIEMIEEALDFFYERPANLEMRWMTLDGRLSEMGKKII